MKAITLNEERTRLAEEAGGTCMMCATASDTVRPYRFGTNFTAYNELSAGDGLCRTCADLISDRTSRQKSWIIENGRRTILERADWIPTMLRDKVVPFILYLTSTHKTQGFVPLMRRPNMGNRTFVLAHDRDVIRVDRGSLDGLLDTAGSLRERRWSKAEMAGEPGTGRHADSAAMERWRSARANPAWPVVVGGLAPLPARREAKE